MVQHREPPASARGRAPSGALADPPAAPTADPAGSVLVRFRGALDGEPPPAVRDRLVELLVTHRSVLLDLGGLVLRSTGALQVLSAALDLAGGWPQARLALVTPDRLVRQALHSSGVSRCMWVAHTVELAAARIALRPPVVRLSWTADPTADAPGRVRTAIAPRCRAWGVDEDAAADALLVVNELVSNAVDHAGTPVRVRLVHDGRELDVRVHDRSTDPPRLQPHDVAAARGRGLQMVDAIADRWGWDVHEDGKTVWAVLPAPLADGAA